MLQLLEKRIWRKLMYFSDFFNVDEKILDSYGALNISLVNDLPLFIDPFLLFNSEKDEYQKLHKNIIDYVIFLRNKSLCSDVNKGLLKSWYHFSEIKQNWLGFSLNGNSGRGLGNDFAIALNKNFSTVLSDFGEEKITHSHLEKLCLFKEGVGKDSISDFTTNLIKQFLLEYTETFAKQYINPKLCKDFAVAKVSFNYITESWNSKNYYLPCFNGDYVLLTPMDILTKDDTWINKDSMYREFESIINSMENEQLRAQLNNYFRKLLPKKPKQKDIDYAKTKTIYGFPEFIPAYIKYKEDNGYRAVAISSKKVSSVKKCYIEGVQKFQTLLSERTSFYKEANDSFEEALRRVDYLKQVIENNDGYKLFYDKKRQIVGSEKDLQLLFKLVWYGTEFSVDSEVNNGRGPVDYKISKGAKNATLVEFKLASNTKLKQNLAHQVEIYKEANQIKNSIKVILYFNRNEKYKVERILKELEINTVKNIVLIDASLQTKVRASNVRDRSEY